jgi:hypothetical protein
MGYFILFFLEHFCKSVVEKAMRHHDKYRFQNHLCKTSTSIERAYTAGAGRRI